METTQLVWHWILGISGVIGMASLCAGWIFLFLYFVTSINMKNIYGKDNVTAKEVLDEMARVFRGN